MKLNLFGLAFDQGADGEGVFANIVEEIHQCTGVVAVDNGDHANTAIKSAQHFFGFYAAGFGQPWEHGWNRNRA